MPNVALIQISVSDLDHAIAWYQEVLGFELSKEHYHHPVAVDLVHQGCRLLLHVAERPATIDYPNASQTLICLGTEDIRRSMAELKSKGVLLLHDEPQEFPGGLFCAFKDPFGNVHELVELRNYSITR